MKILIYGKTASGKSTLAKELSKITGMKYHSMGELFRKENRDDLTKTAEDMLRKDLNCNMKYIYQKFEGDFDNVIYEGFRNPVEFSKLLDSNCIIIKLNHTGVPYKDNFEKEGINLIDAVVKFTEKRGSLIFKEFSYSEYEELDWVLDFIKLLIRK